MEVDLTIPYKAVCIFAIARTGSDLLCDQIGLGLQIAHGINSVELNELLGPQQVISAENRPWWIGLKKTYFNDIPLSRRPIPGPMSLDRLHRLPSIIDSGCMPVFKLFTSIDITEFNYQTIRKMIIDNDEVYKICLNRKDTKQQLLSWCIAVVTNIFHSRGIGRGDTMDDAVHEIELHRIVHEAKQYLEHWIWHQQNAYLCHKQVWYEDLLTESYDELGFSASQVITKSVKITHDHVEKCRRHISNHQEVFDLVDSLVEEMAQIQKLVLAENNAAKAVRRIAPSDHYQADQSDQITWSLSDPMTS
jgi:hypothetical protein